MTMLDKNTKVGIIGAGPAGVHMAYRLKKLGYQDVKILERNDTPGGKSKTYLDKKSGVYVEQGTTWAVLKNPHLKAFFEELGVECNIKMQMGFIVNDKAMDMKSYAYIEYLKKHNITPPGSKEDFDNYTNDITNATAKYIKLHQMYMGNDPIPKEEYASELSITFKEFLANHELSILETVTSTLVAANAYANETFPVSAYYGLMWITKEVLTPGGTCYVDGGYQSVWKKAIEKEKIDVEYNCNVDKVLYNHGSGKSDVYCSGEKDHYTFDFLINATPFTLKYLLHPTSLQKDVLSKNTWAVEAINNIVRTKDLDNFSNNSPALGHMKGCEYKLGEEYIYPVCAAQFMYKVYNIDSADKSELMPVYQWNLIPLPYGYDASKLDVNQVRDELTSQLTKYFHQTDIEFVTDTQIWPDYFPHFSNEDIKAGYPWKLLNEVQAEINMWFIGDSCSFELVPSVIHYNDYLLEKFELFSGVDSAPSLDDTDL